MLMHSLRFSDLCERMRDNTTACMGCQEVSWQFFSIFIQIQKTTTGERGGGEAFSDLSADFSLWNLRLLEAVQMEEGPDLVPDNSYRPARLQLQGGSGRVVARGQRETVWCSLVES